MAGPQVSSSEKEDRITAAGSVLSERLCNLRGSDGKTLEDAVRAGRRRFHLEDTLDGGKFTFDISGSRISMELSYRGKVSKIEGSVLFDLLPDVSGMGTFAHALPLGYCVTGDRAPIERYLSGRGIKKSDVEDLFPRDQKKYCKYVELLNK